MYLLMGVRVELVLMLYVTFILAAPAEELKTKIIPTVMKIMTCFILFYSKYSMLYFKAGSQNNLRPLYLQSTYLCLLAAEEPPVLDKPHQVIKLDVAVVVVVSAAAPAGA